MSISDERGEGGNRNAKNPVEELPLNLITMHACMKNSLLTGLVVHTRHMHRGHLLTREFKLRVLHVKRQTPGKETFHGIRQ